MEQEIKLYDVLEHTADIMIRAYGKSLPELYQNAMIGMEEQVIESKELLSSGELIEVNITDNGDEVSMLREFLNSIKDLLYFGYPHATKPVPCFPVCIGIPIQRRGVITIPVFIKQAKMVFSDEIKMVTYHEMKVEYDSTAKLWSADVVFDV